MDAGFGRDGKTTTDMVNLNLIKNSDWPIVTSMKFSTGQYQPIFTYAIVAITLLALNLLICMPEHQKKTDGTLYEKGGPTCEKISKADIQGEVCDA